MFLKKKKLTQQLEEERRHLEQPKTGPQADQQSDNLLLGNYIRGDTFPAHIGIHKQGPWIKFEEWLLDQHFFIVGATGAGKSETLKRLIYEIAVKTDRDIFFVDGKGDEVLAQEIRAICAYGGRGNAPIFRLGHKKGYPYHGFMGETDAVYNRLCAMVGVQDAQGDARYYADINRNILQLVCGVPEGPPRSFSQLRQRLNRDWLEQAWSHDPSEIEVLASLSRKDLSGLQTRVWPLARVLEPVVKSNGFVLEQTRAAIFSIRTQSVGDTAARFLQFLVEDFKDFVGNRQRRPGVFIIDEFGAFGNKNILALLTLARSAKLGVILATQDIASLGDDVTTGDTRMVLANTRTKILMASDFPEEVATLAGTIYQIESSMQHEQGEATGMGSARIQHAFKVEMNEAGKLQAGEGFIIRQRHAAKLKVAQVTGVPPAPPEVIPDTDDGPPPQRPKGPVVEL